MNTFNGHLFLASEDYPTISEIDNTYEYAVCVEVEGGHMIFATYDDYNVWHNQI